MFLGRWIGRSLRGDLEIVFLLYWVMILCAEDVPLMRLLIEGLFVYDGERV